MRAQRKFKKVNLMPKILRFLTAEYVTWPVRTSGKKKSWGTYGVLRQISLLRDWMSQIRAKVILFPKIELRTIRLPYPPLLPSPSSLYGGSVTSISPSMSLNITFFYIADIVRWLTSPYEVWLFFVLSIRLTSNRWICFLYYTRVQARR